MTYVPVDSPQGGRKPIGIPAALLSQLQHSAATGARCRIELGPDDDPAEIDELRRAIVRAGYTHFRQYTIRKRIKPETFTFWVTPKVGTGNNGKR